MTCTLSKAQVRRLIERHGKKLSGTVTNEKLVYIKLPTALGVAFDGPGADVDVQDILGNSLGKITVKEAWAL